MGTQLLEDIIGYEDHRLRDIAIKSMIKESFKGLLGEQKPNNNRGSRSEYAVGVRGAEI
jgi:hypothetical protein